MFFMLLIMVLSVLTLTHPYKLMQSVVRVELQLTVLIIIRDKILRRFSGGASVGFSTFVVAGISYVRRVDTYVDIYEYRYCTI